jgi:hypothetical protein
MQVKVTSSRGRQESGTNGLRASVKEDTHYQWGGDWEPSQLSSGPNFKSGMIKTFFNPVSKLLFAKTELCNCMFILIHSFLFVYVLTYN